MSVWRATVAAGYLVVASRSPAAADSMGFLRIAAGGSVPMADSTWQQGQEPGLKLSAGAALVRRYGVMATVDYAFVRVAQASALYPLDAEHQTLRRLRVLGHVVYELDEIEEGVSLMVRVGGGLDRFYASHDRLLAGTYYPASRTHSGIAVELGSAVWFDIPGVGSDIDIGLELALPIAKHTETPDYLGRTAGSSYTSVDIDVLAGVRFTSLD